MDFGILQSECKYTTVPLASERTLDIAIDDLISFGKKIISVVLFATHTLFIIVPGVFDILPGVSDRKYSVFILNPVCLLFIHDTSICIEFPDIAVVLANQITLVLLVNLASVKYTFPSVAS